MLNAAVALRARRVRPDVQRPKLRPHRVFVPRDSSIESMDRSPRAVHGL